MALWWIGCLVMQKMYGVVAVWQWRTVWCSDRMRHWQTAMQSVYCTDGGFLTQSLYGAWHSTMMQWLYGTDDGFLTQSLWCSYRMPQWQAMMQWLYGTDDGFLTQSLYGAVTVCHSDRLWCRLYGTDDSFLTHSLHGAVTAWHNTMMQWLYGTDDGFIAHAESVWCSDCMTQWMNIWCSDVRTRSNCGCNLNDAGYCASHVVQSYIVWCDGCSCESQ